MTTLQKYFDGVLLDCTEDDLAHLAALAAAAVNAPDAPRTISRRQFATQIGLNGDITQDEAVAWLGGTLPAVFANAIAQLPANEQFQVKMALFASNFDRTSQWTEALGGILQKSDAQLDAIWIAASAIV